MTGWNLPPGVTNQMIDDYFGGGPTCGECRHFYVKEELMLRWCMKFHRTVEDDDSCNENTAFERDDEHQSDEMKDLEDFHSDC